MGDCQPEMPGQPPSTISPSKKLQRWRHLLEEHFLSYFFQSLNKLRKLLASRDLDADTRMTHRCDRLVETHPTQHQTKLKPSPLESYRSS